MTQTFRVGDRVVVGPTSSLAGRYTGEAGTITVASDEVAMVKLDGEQGRARYFYLTTLRPEKNTMNIKQLAKDLINGFQTKTAATKDAVVKEYLAATALCTPADARKKKAKDALIKEGIVLAEYRPGEVEAYRSAAFVVVAKTKQPTSKLDQDELRSQLKIAGLSQAKIDRAFAAATTDNKPATSYEVTQL